MAESYGPFAGGAGANFTETQWREAFGNIVTSGVVKGALVSGSAGADLAVSAPGGAMSVNLGTGVACAYGFFYENDSTLAKTISAADPSNPRIDRIVIKLDFAGRTVQSAVKTGTPAGSPSPPALTQNATTWEIPIAQIAVAAGATQITSGNVTDERAYATLRWAGSGGRLDADKLDGIDSTGFGQVGSHNSISPLKISAGTTLPGTLDSREIFILLS